MHSYNADDNAKIFGNSYMSSIMDDIKESPLKDRIHLSCNLIKGYIDSPDEIKKYLDNAANLGIKDVGFVSLMPVNEYCKEHFIDYNDINFDNIEEMFSSTDYNYDDRCRCRNYLYLSNDGTPIKIYVRYYVDGNFCLSTLVYDGKNLKQGFRGSIII
jgi:molybdenum cofactor biosynthesis enzyme MoaA